MPKTSTTGGLLANVRVQQAILAAAFLGLAVHLYWSVRALFVFNIDIGGIEGNVVYGIQKLMMGLPLYQDPELPTFDVIQYTPLYYYLTTAIGMLCGVDPHEPQQVFILSRASALACNLGTVWVTFRIIRGFQVERWLAWPSALLVFALLTRHFLSRPDALYLLLFAASMGAFLRALAPGAMRTRGLIIATLLACLAVLTKQSGVLPLGIIGLHLLLSGDRRDLLRVALVATVVLGAAFVLLGRLYGEHVLYLNIVTGLRNGFSTELYREVFLTPRYVLIVGFHCIGAYFFFRYRNSPDARRRALALGIVATFLFALITGAKSGSRLNYFLENFLLIAVALPLVIQEAHVPKRRWLPYALVGYCALTLLQGPWRMRSWVRLWESANGELLYRQASALHTWLRAEKGLSAGEYVLVLGRDPIEHFIVGHGVLDQKDILLYSRAEVYDRSLFVKAMRNGDVRFVISRVPVEPVRFLGEVYREFRTIAGPEGYAIRAYQPEGEIP